ncbi:MAG: NUDIX pyrophosphatase [Bacteroidota bacterium]
MPKLNAQYIEICIFKFENDRVQYLLMHRTKNVNIYPGIWQIITANIEPNEKATDTAKREITEETGLTPTALWVVPKVNSFYNNIDDTINFITFFAAQAPPGSIPKLSSEHDKYEWVSLDETQKRLVWPGQREAVKIVSDYIIKGDVAGEVLRIF